MSYGFNRSSARRQQRRWAILKWLFLLCAVLAAGVFSYVEGSALAKREVTNLRTEATRLADLLSKQRDRNKKLQKEAEVARAGEAQWRQRYEKDVPTGNTKQLMARIQTQLANKVPAERIDFMIGAAGIKDSCDGRPITKRFLVRTPLFAGANDAVNFAERTITVSAGGLAAADSLGNPEEWFDPAQEVTVWFVELGGKRTSKVTGELPLYHSVVRSDAEYRFTIAKGDRRGFLHVTGDRCPLPKAPEEVSR